MWLTEHPLTDVQTRKRSSPKVCQPFPSIELFHSLPAYIRLLQNYHTRVVCFIRDQTDWATGTAAKTGNLHYGFKKTPPQCWYGTNQYQFPAFLTRTGRDKWERRSGRRPNTTQYNTLQEDAAILFARTLWHNYFLRWDFVLAVRKDCATCAI